ncbi:MAG: NmrA/HSCARG family protein [Bacteroidota bacterium]
MAETKTILVTGATGQQGGAVASELLSHGFSVNAMTRKPDSDKAKALATQGARIVTGDLNDPASLEAALKGVWGVFAVQNTWEAGVEKEEEQGKRIAAVAQKAGVQHFVYSSVGSAQRKTGIPHFDNKYRVEETIRGLGFPSYTIIRPVFFMENIASPWFKPAIEQGNIMTALKPDTPLQMIAVQDIGKYGLWAFRDHEKLNGRAIDIAGDSLTMPQTAKAISAVSGKQVGFAPIPIEEIRKGSEDFALMLEWFDAVGYDVDIQGMAKESGIKPTPFSQWAATIKW